MFLLKLLYSVFECFWRRWFGGKDIGGEKCEDMWFNQRWFRHIIGFIVTSLFLFVWKYNLIQCILGSCVLQFLYWARAHGEFFDFGHNNPPDVSRYEKEWWWKYVKTIMPENVWYSYTCDFICMFVRYTLPSLLLSVILLSVTPIMMGLTVASSYAIMWCFHDWYGLKNPTEWGEYMAGFFTGLLLLS